MHCHTNRTTHTTAFHTSVVAHWLGRKTTYSSLVERLVMVRRVVGSIPHDGPIELFLVSASAPRLD